MYTVHPFNSTQDGLDLTYVQCASLVAYLIDHYSFEKVIKVCKDYRSSKSVFEKTFDQVYIDWVEFLSNKYNNN